ncbi:MAG: T9SS type A sorting domain-containing protein [Chlorobi bacterium]|nr:T9SS type A sorting domain-containing protein [Chlorobiota bacterium]
MKIIFSLIALIILSSTSSAQSFDKTKKYFKGEKTLSLSWNLQTNLTHKQSYEGNYGSTSFCKIDKDRTAFLNESENEISVFNNDKKEMSFKSGITPSLGLNFIADNYFVFGLYECAIHKSNGELIKTIKLPSSLKVVEKVTEVGGNIFFVSSNQNSYLYAGDKFVKFSGIPLYPNIFVKAIKQSYNMARIVFIESNLEIKSFNFNTDKELASLKIIGGNKSNLYLDVEYIKQEKPLIAEREIIAIDIKNNHFEKLDNTILLNEYYLSVRQDISVLGDSMYYYSTSPSKATVYCLSLNSNVKKEIFTKEELSNTYHFNNHLLPVLKNENNSVIKSPPDSIVNPISRTEIIARAEAFETYVWTASSENIYDGNWCDNQFVYSAPWVQVGNNRSMPYMWDGFSSLEKYDAGMELGLSAGNTNTSTNIGSMNCAEGVDCSGFVSQAWNTKWKYDTREFYHITVEYSSWLDLKPGDIANKSGHVRLFHSWNENGTMNMLEATSRDNVWRVVYNTYTISSMQYVYNPYYLYSVYTGTNSAEHKQLSINKIIISPNPVKTTFRVLSNPTDLLLNADYKIIDCNAKVIKTGKVSISDESIDISTLKKGIYFIVLRNNNFEVSKILVKV